MNWPGYNFKIVEQEAGERKLPEGKEDEYERRCAIAQGELFDLSFNLSGTMDLFLDAPVGRLV